MKIHYVVGFLFSPDREWVILIRKTKPDWQKGRYNGVGGKIETTDVAPVDAMIREFKEETDVNITEWDDVAVLESPQYNVHVFKASSSEFTNVITTTEEEVCIVEVSSIYSMSELEIVPNLKWLIPLALNDENKYVHVYYP